ncbi:2-cysteine peroxiredoxin [Mycena venus]|uniref:2-cysteine peroxiredoxin n=1 Tax=Mycena venus TaxID=2733690 RepID=A0A8H6X5Q0_9AGAR|nr:2-cysteine peroxiredoxin [Mycena venus]
MVSSVLTGNPLLSCLTLGCFTGWFLLFYPMDFTFVCPTEILAFNDALPALEAINTVVLGISTDSQFSHLAWSTQPRKQGGLGPDLKLPLVADKSMQISRDYGVLLEDEGIALRGLFIIDPKGILRQITVNDLPVGRSVDETMRLIKAFQFTDQYGEVCPANWIEGAKTIKADPKASLEYFDSANPEKNGNGVTNGSGVPAKRARVE